MLRGTADSSWWSAREASSGSSAAPTAPMPKFTPITWSAVVTTDRAYYDRIQAEKGLSGSDLPFPARMTERRFALSGKQMRIGRRSTARGTEPEIDLSEPPVDPGISRLHALLLPAPGGFWAVLDPGSANGTLLNGREIPPGDLIPLRDGDRINLGAWTAITIRRQ
jgi:pSer/pThr/pTyr-binding forkhead associated (FHA) protein